MTDTDRLNAEVARLKIQLESVAALGDELLSKLRRAEDLLSEAYSREVDSELAQKIYRYFADTTRMNEVP